MLSNESLKERIQLPSSADESVNETVTERMRIDLTSLDGAILLPTFSPEARSEHTLSSSKPNVGRRDFNKQLYWYVLVDILALVAGVTVAWLIADITNITLFGRHELSNPLLEYGVERLTQFLIIAAGVVLWFYHTGHYTMRIPFLVQANKIIGALCFATVIDGFMQFASKQDFSRFWLMSGWAIAAVFIIGLRAVLRNILQRRGSWQVSTLLVGNGETARDTRAAIMSEPSLGYSITAQIENLPLAFLRAGRSWEKLCAAYNVDYVIIALDGEDLERAKIPITQLIREALPFSISPPIHHLPVQGMAPQYFFNHNVMLLARNSGLDQPLPRLVKRAFDVAVSGTALLVTGPIIAILAALVKLDGGPAFYGHSRIGQNGKRFSCIKLRSMIADSDRVLREYLDNNPLVKMEWQATQKLKHDPRITRIGKFLRTSSLDELPQLLNVLKGDMSLVGPRPIVTDEIRKYEGDIAYYYSVRPGITGIWQVSGRNDVSYAQRVQMDGWYVRNWSFLHDIAIICKTFPALLLRRGVY